MDAHIGNPLESAARFGVYGTVLAAEPYGSGHINDTYRVTADQAGAEVHYLLQRVNHHVFRDVPALMENVERVTRHVRERGERLGVPDGSRRTLTLVPTRDGASYTRDAEGNFWRMYLFIERARTYDRLERADQARRAAHAFAAFQAQLADLPAPRLHETIPHFHDTPARYAALEDAVRHDPVNRAASVRAEIEFVRSRRAFTETLTRAHAEGRVPERVTHNDTKLNNVMLDDATGEGVCVIDLDTVMPGLALYDFGDMVRSGTNSADESEPDTSRVTFREDVFEALARGYLEGAREFLTPAECDAMALSGPLITLEIGIRFLTDYLDGDRYFKIHRPGQNLDRCRTQFKLVSEMERARDRMEAIVRRYR